LFLLQRGQAVAELVERARDVAILGIASAVVTIEVQLLCPFPLEERQLDVVGEEEQLVWV
jgi:hypothetical protein